MFYIECSTLAGQGISVCVYQRGVVQVCPSGPLEEGVLLELDEIDALIRALKVMRDEAKNA